MSKKERKYSKAEKRRLEFFNQLIDEYKNKGYTTRDLTTTPLKANLVGPLYGLVVSLPFIILFVLLYKGTPFIQGENYFRNYLIYIVLMFLFIVVHELLHGITFASFSKDGFKSIEFGVKWESLNPYCTCNTPLTRKGYILSLLMPCIVLGFIPCIISLFNKNAWYLAMGVIMILSAGGDLLICKLLLQDKEEKDELYLDHPTDIGLIKFVRNDK